MITTRFTQLFGLDYPIMSAPMAMYSGGRLAAAVSKAGALGSFGGVHRTKGPDWLAQEVALIRSKTDRPFGIGFITPFIPFVAPLFEAAFKAKPAVIAFSFPYPGPYTENANSPGERLYARCNRCPLPAKPSLLARMSWLLRATKLAATRAR